MTSWKWMTIALAGSACLAITPGAQAQVFVNGNGEAYSCYNTTKTGNRGTNSAIRTCTRAIQLDPDADNVAASHINRGVLYMRKGNIRAAITDLETGIAMNPAVAEGYINLSAAYFYDKREDDALIAINTALDKGTQKLAEAHYNRALILEKLGQTRQAYYDYKAALSHRPDWDMAEEAVSRFTVSRKAG